MTACARLISSGVSLFLTPSEPFVSTLISTPISAAFFFKASAAMKVCAIPVGQAVTAIMNGRLPARFFCGAGSSVVSSSSANNI